MVGLLLAVRAIGHLAVSAAALCPRVGPEKVRANTVAAQEGTVDAGYFTDSRDTPIV